MHGIKKCQCIKFFFVPFLFLAYRVFLALCSAFAFTVGKCVLLLVKLLHVLSDVKHIVYNIFASYFVSYKTFMHCMYTFFKKSTNKTAQLCLYLPKGSLTVTPCVQHSYKFSLQIVVKPRVAQRDPTSIYLIKGNVVSLDENYVCCFAFAKQQKKIGGFRK